MSNTIELSVEGMSCQNCVRHVREALTGIRGVQSADVSLEEKRAVVTHDGTVPAPALIAAVEEEGYEAKKR
jgi:copper chaperone CopZ